MRKLFSEATRHVAAKFIKVFSAHLASPVVLGGRRVKRSPLHTVRHLYRFCSGKQSGTGLQYGQRSSSIYKKVYFDLVF